MEAIVNQLTSPIAGLLDRVIDVFDAELASDLPFVDSLTRQVRAYRGKLLRPRLLLLSARAAGDVRHDHIVLGAVVEMVHMATLVHDDVLDEADVRRHSRTVNRLEGNQAAVMLGDYLISHAYHLCSSLGSTRASRRIAAATNTVCEGELAQIHRRGDFDITEADYLQIIRKKTAALTSVCCELGAEFAGASRDVVDHMAAFGNDLGVAFQIVDDLLDVTGTQRETGKSVGRDADLGKLTLPVIRCLSVASPAQRARMLETLAGADGSITGRLQHELEASDGIEYAMDLASSYVQSAINHMSCLAPSDARDALAAAAEYVLQRRQ
jgi:octaprenyl-diphosphate synthase